MLKKEKSLEVKTPLRLFCFPYAGGTPWVFAEWSSSLPDTVVVHPIDFYFSEGADVTTIRTMPDIIQRLVHTLSFDFPFAFAWVPWWLLN